MPEYKNNHYVPAFHLKEWSDNDVTVKTFLLAQNDSISKPVAIADQVSKPYLYGKDRKVEKLLADIEADAEQQFERLISTGDGNIPKLDKIKILAFLAICSMRTLWQKQDLTKMADAITKELIDSTPEANELPSDWKDKCTIEYNFVRHMKQVLLIAYFMLTDMDISVCSVKDELFTCDNPVSLLNMFKYKEQECGLGFASAGLIMAMPIDPHHFILAYDCNVYKVNPLHAKASEINALTAQNAINTIYYSGDIVEDIRNHCKSFRQNRVEISKKVINGQDYSHIRSKSNAVTFFNKDFISIKDDFDETQIVAEKLAAPGEVVYVRKDADFGGQLIMAYKEYLLALKKQADISGEPIDQS